MPDTVTYNTTCLRIERTDGVILGITELDIDIVIADSLLGLTGGTRTYSSVAGFTPSNVQSTSDNAVNNADIEGMLTSVGVARDDIVGGRYDFALLHVFIWDWKNNLLVKKLASGHWGEATLKDGRYTAEFRSLSQQLQQRIGRTYTPECDEQLGGSRCTIPLGLFPKEDGIVSANTSKNYLIDNLLYRDDDYWNGITLTWTSGANNTVSSPILDYILAETKLVLTTDMPNYIGRGDTYTISKNELTDETVTTVGATKVFTDTSRTEADNYFNGDDIVFDSGLNSGNTYTIATFLSDAFTLTTDATDLFLANDQFHINKTFSGGVTVVDTQRTQFQTDLTEVDGFFDSMVLTFTSGANITETVTITSYVQTNGVIVIPSGLPNDIDVSTFNIVKVINSTITSVNERLQFKDSSLVEANSYFNGMTLEFTDGPNISETFIISDFSNDIFTFDIEATNDISISDEYKVDYIRNGTTTDGASKTVVYDSSLTASDYTGMYLEFSSGLNVGEFSLISDHDMVNDLITLTTAMTFDILNSDTYTIINMTGDTYMTFGEVESVTDSSKFICTSLVEGTFPDDYFNYGKLIFTSGLNEKIHMEVKEFNGTTGEFTLFLPMPFEVAIGDNFQVFAGCDKRLVTCKTKFNIIANPTGGNVINFQGFPYIPGQDQISLFGGQ